MKKEDLIKKIEGLKNDLRDQMCDEACGFCDCWEWYNIRYLSDAISEYADSNTNIYYSDQRDYFYKDPKRASDLLKEYGYELDSFNDLDDAICKAGAVMEYSDIESAIYNDLEDVKKYLLLSNILYILKNTGFKYNFIVLSAIVSKIDILDLEDDSIPGCEYEDIKEYCNI